MPLTPPKLCAECREPFTPREDSQRFCRRRCVYHWLSRQRKGHPPTAAIEKLRSQRGQAARARLAAEFGELSEREVRLYAAAFRDGYGQGYDAGIAPMRAKAS